jgi:hypothetical protein
MDIFEIDREYQCGVHIQQGINDNHICVTAMWAKALACAINHWVERWRLRLFFNYPGEEELSVLPKGSQFFHFV